MMTPASACHRNRKRHSTGIDHRSEGTKTAVNGESNKFVVSVKVTNILFITAGSSPAGSFRKSNQQVVSFRTASGLFAYMLALWNRFESKTQTSKAFT